jgi:predicted membrane metal-binding protein
MLSTTRPGSSSATCGPSATFARAPWRSGSTIFVVQPGYLIERLRERLRRSFSTVLGDAPHAGILVALAIGDQQAIPAQQWRLFRQTGVTFT